MPNPRMKQRLVVHKSTAGILKPIPEAVDLVGNPPLRLTTKTVALLHQRVGANRRESNPAEFQRTHPRCEHLVQRAAAATRAGSSPSVRALVEALILPDVG